MHTISAVRKDSLLRRVSARRNFPQWGAGSVIGIYASGDKSGKAEIEIFTNVIHGKITSVAADNLKAEIDGTEYDCISSIGSLKPGFTYSFVTDNDGCLYTAPEAVPICHMHILPNFQWRQEH